ncbi:MAG: DinB family protein [Bacteroidota bacterium]|nr:DinB family protein [Bacteroidota bacterium]
MTNKEFFIQTWKNESKITAGAVRALPTDMSKLAYKPSGKCRSAMEIISHILPHAEELNIATKAFVISEDSKEFSGIEEAAAYFEKNAAEVADNLEKIDDATWEEKIIPLEVFGNKLFEAPMMNMYWMFIFEMIHHRGQLSTYYRPMGVVNPRIYGPTAEDVEKMQAASN